MLCVGQPETSAFFAFPSKHANEQVSATTEDLVRAISVILRNILTSVSCARTDAEFAKSRASYFPQYAQVMLSLSALLTVSVPDDVLARLSVSSLAELEHEFQKSGTALGPAIQEQAVFTIWTFQKINELTRKCNAHKVLPELKDADEEFRKSFVNSILYARFHLDCLYLSLHTQKPLFPEVLEKVSDGLRAAVDAYAWVKQGWELRSPRKDEPTTDVVWDEEQEELLRSSDTELLREVY